MYVIIVKQLKVTVTVQLLALICKPWTASTITVTNYGNLDLSVRKNNILVLVLVLAAAKYLKH